MSDRELLKLAAKAVGINYCATLENGTKCIHTGRGYWNALTDDGDYSRLEAALGLNVLWGSRTVSVGRKHFGPFEERYQDHNGDRQRARRRAGVCAATHIVQHIQ